jgi:hypothetical protein
MASCLIHLQAALGFSAVQHAVVTQRISVTCVYLRSMTDLIAAACTGNTIALPGLNNCTACSAAVGPGAPVPDSTRTFCQCPDGYIPKPGTSYAAGNLECQICPAGTFAQAGSTRCQPCRGYYQYSAAGASSCSSCKCSTHTISNDKP